MESEKKNLDYRWIIILLLLIVGIGLYFYQSYKLNHLKSDLSTQADIQLNNQNEQMLKLAAQPLVWAIRSEMLHNNPDQINILITDLVKQNGVLDINLLNADGKIINSTNKKLEDTFASDDYKSYLSQDSVTVINTSDSVARVIAPVMGYQSKLGVLVMNCKVERFNPD